MEVETELSRNFWMLAAFAAGVDLPPPFLRGFGVKSSLARIFRSSGARRAVTGSTLYYR